MKYMLMMHAPRAGWKDAGIGTWPMDDIKAHIAFMMRFHDELKQSGELVDAQGLAGHALGLEDVADLLGRLLEEPGFGRDRAAHADHAGQ